MPTEADWAEYERVLAALKAGSAAELENLAASNATFPYGTDSCFNRHWISNAITSGSRPAIEWLLSKGVDLTFRDDEGYTVLLWALERKANDRYEILSLLLRHGAPIDAHGINDWTAAHMAASRDDVEALKVLKQHGANLAAISNDFSPRTPLQSAVALKKEGAIAFLKEWA